MTQPVFVIGTGRCGTRMIYKMLDGTPGVEVYHEYQIYHVQPFACRLEMDTYASGDEHVLRRTHGAALHYSRAHTWVDCSNKLSWLIPSLLHLFPDARFLHLVRDGRRVALSYYHKLSDEIYDDRSTAILRDWVDGRSMVMPPPDKKYWWKLPPDGYNQWQRICWHWRECNRVILRDAPQIPVGHYMNVKLEYLTKDDNLLREVLDFMGITYQPRYFDALQTPRGVIEPVNYAMTETQERQFWKICADMMEHFSYNGPLYEVDYGHV